MPSKMFMSLYIVFFSVLFLPSQSAAEADEHLSRGTLALSQGKLEEALSHYHLAIEGDPNSFLTRYRRATVYLGLGRVLLALSDLTKSLDLNPNFKQALFQRASLFLKLGRCTEAVRDLEMFKGEDYEGLEELIGKLDVSKERRAALSHVPESDLLSKADISGSILELSPWDTELRLMHSRLCEQVGRSGDAIADLRVARLILSGDTSVLLRLTLLHYASGDLAESLSSAKECLRLDQDHSACFSHYKKAKKLIKQLDSADQFLGEGKHAEAVSELERCLSTEREAVRILARVKAKLCHAHRHLGDLDQVSRWCREALELDPRNVDVLCDRAEQHIDSDMLDEALEDYRQAKEINSDFKRAQEGIERVQKLQKQASKRDYYKILGVKRSARKKEIIKAYRLLAQEWHPDRFTDPEEKQQAEKKFIDIAAAKEVLTNREKREKFDNGEDPLDPDKGGQQHWHQGPHGFPFGAGGGGGGGGFTFKFHF